MNWLLAFANIVLTALVTLLLLAIYIKRTLPNILEEVAIGAGESITSSLQELFEKPSVKHAMSILGKQSGEIRADKALQEKAAEAFINQSPAISMALEKIGITPLEGVKLFNDPLFGPMIQNFLGGFLNLSNNPGQQNQIGRM